MARVITLLLLLFLIGANLPGQSERVKRYALPRRVMPLEKALIKLTEAGAPISYRPDQLPKIAVKSPGGRRQLSTWLQFLLRDTELTFRPGPAGFLILPDPHLFERNFSIHGLISDATSGERLIGAAVYDPGSEKGVLSNEYGFYSLVTKGGRTRMRVSYTGYEAYDFEVVLRSDTTLDIRLDRAADLPQIEVIAKGGEQEELYLTESGISLSHDAVNLINGLGGEKDIVTVARLLPGITSGANGVGGLIIRGSNSGHNLVLLDGVPVYNLNHAAGLFSIFNSEAIRRADVYKDGMPARFGGRIGGILDVHTRDGNLYNHQVSVGTSLFASNLTAEGPISKGKSSYLISGRYFWGGDLLKSFSEARKLDQNRVGYIDYDVYDLNFKLNQQVGEKGRLYLSLYRGADGYANTSEQKDSATILTQSGTVFKYTANQKRQEDVNWSNTVGALRYNYEFSDRFFGNFRLSYSELLVRANFERSDSLYESVRDVLTRDISSGRFGSDIQQMGAAFDGQFEVDGNTSLRFGTSVDIHRFLPQLRSGQVPLNSHPELSGLNESDKLRSLQISGYASLKGRVKGIHYRLGLRGQIWHNDKTFLNVSPRLLLAGQFNERNRWRVTYDRMVQPIHLVSSTVIRLPTDLWVPATGNLPPSTSRQVAFQVDRQLKPGWSLAVAAYYRQLEDLVEYSGGGSNNNWLENLSRGDGFAKGLELTLHGTRGQLAGWLNYTLAESRRQFDEDVNLGRSFPFDYDRRHSLKLLLTLALSKRTDLSATWRFETGGAYSFSKESIILANPTIDDPDSQAQVIALIDEKNGFRFPAYHQLDVNARFQLTREPERRVQHTLNLGIYNLYARHNPIFYDIRSTYLNRNNTLLKNRQFVQVFFGGILPTLSYKASFK
ncbi:TonB-dependent receptor [Neolewinella aurantiaca]|uniref:TonB-dependent receptor n=1 Tax=Neolewinella aurantiaca TaxID=2602767 RepID=A0A5C7F521_9BACT|nr:carboxypeptidase-like regulatory domain-containing protein [Neolewinella aurantiaca]TXF85692.1 TonB-dependent receptor [Neolewinella aurantiaca]